MKEILVILEMNLELDHCWWEVRTIIVCPRIHPNCTTPRLLTYRTLFKYTSIYDIVHFTCIFNSAHHASRHHQKLTVCTRDLIIPINQQKSDTRNINSETQFVIVSQFLSTYL